MSTMKFCREWFAFSFVFFPFFWLHLDGFMCVYMLKLLLFNFTFIFFVWEFWRLSWAANFGILFCLIWGTFICSNNILYPKDDKEQKILLYACRNCDHQVLIYFSFCVLMWGCWLINVACIFFYLWGCRNQFLWFNSVKEILDVWLLYSFGLEIDMYEYVAIQSNDICTPKGVLWAIWTGECSLWRLIQRLLRFAKWDWSWNSNIFLHLH